MTKNQSTLKTGIAVFAAITVAYQVGKVVGKAQIASLVKTHVIEIMKDQLSENSK